MGTACFQGDRSLSSRSKRSESGPCREAPRGPVRERPHTWQRMPVSAGPCGQACCLGSVARGPARTVLLARVSPVWCLPL